MKNILAPGQRELLEPFAWSQTLVAFDFDGTLAPIVADPKRAALRASTRARLRRTAELYPCVVISGRAMADVRQRLAGIPLKGVVGNHGVEPWSASRKVHQRVRDWRPVFERALSGESGVVLEDKAYSLAIHFRRSRAKKRVRSHILRAAAHLPGARLVGGIEVMNVVPVDAPHKGMALERERARLGCDTAIYVGDDTTDEDVFALDQPGRLLTVRIGRKQSSKADFYLRSQSYIDPFLEALVGLRAPKSGDSGRTRRRPRS